MKNKYDEQRLDRERHKSQRQADKARRASENSIEIVQTAPTRVELPTILIVCEGANTEPTYFDKFRLRSAIVEAVGEGYNTISLVNRAIQLRDEDNYEKVWVVFDKDDFKDSAFHDAIQLAEKEGFGVAWSNQAFEYWLILHFEDHQGGGMHRDNYGKKINNYIVPLGAYYDSKSKKKIISNRFFDILESIDPKTGHPRRDLAVQRAKRIYSQCTHILPAKAESCTLVYQLIEDLMSYNKPPQSDSNSNTLDAPDLPMNES